MKERDEKERGTVREREKGKTRRQERERKWKRL